MNQLKRMKIIIVLLLAVFVLTACDNTSSTSTAEKPAAKEGLIGKTAPDFTLTDMAGQQVSLSQYRGKVVILNFWATWCPPCREEMPSMEALYQKIRIRVL